MRSIPSQLLAIALLGTLPGCSEKTASPSPTGPATGTADLKATQSSTAFPDDAVPLATWIDTFKKDPSVASRLQSLDHIINTSHSDLGVVITTALEDPEPEIRRRAMAMVDQLESTESIPLLASASHDADEFVRADAFDFILRLPAELQLDPLSTALSSPHSDTRTNTISALANRRSKLALEILLEAVDDPDPAVTKTAAAEIQALIGQSFDSANEARSWWKTNADTFDTRLRAINP